MWKYPIRTETEQEKRGYVKYSEAIKWCNQSFLEGFIAALCETPEEYEALTTNDRIKVLFCATERCSILRREKPETPDFIGGGGDTVALIPYRLLQSLTACERGLAV